MSYSRIMYAAAALVGTLYSLGYLSPRLREEIEDKMSPLVVFPLLFLIGVYVGMYAACWLAPASFLASHEGRKWMRVIGGTDRPKIFRAVCLAALLFFLFATFVVLYNVVVLTRE